MATAAAAAQPITTAHRGMFTSKSAEWYTPPDLLAEIRAFFGGDYYDPCPPMPALAAVEGAENVTSLHGRVNGLAVAWRSPTFLNSPYGREIGLWTRKALLQPDLEIILLVPSRTGTRWFKPLYAHSVCFIEGRVHFQKPGGEEELQRRKKKQFDGAPFDSALIYRNDRHPERHAEFARAFAHRGVTVQRMPLFARMEREQQMQREAAQTARGRRTVRQPVLIAAS